MILLGIAKTRERKKASEEAVRTVEGETHTHKDWCLKYGSLEVHGIDGDKVMTTLFNKLLVGEWMPEEWRSVLILINKNKENAQCCGSYRGIKLINHTTKIWERIQSQTKR